MKVGQFGSGETADTRLGSTQRKSIRMAVAVECLQERPVSAGLRTVALGLKARERLAVYALPFRLGKGRVHEDIDGQVKAGLQIVSQALERHVRPIPPTTRRDRRAHRLSGQGDLFRGSRAGALVEHGDHQLGQSGPVRWLKRGSARNDDRPRDGGQVISRKYPE